MRPIMSPEEDYTDARGAIVDERQSLSQGYRRSISQGVVINASPKTE